MENILINFMKELYHSIPRKLIRVIKAKGCITKSQGKPIEVRIYEVVSYFEFINNFV